MRLFIRKDLRKMDELINEIEDTVISLIKYDMKTYPDMAQSLANKMMIMFPAIIDCYNNPVMQDKREDAVYWPSQLQRVIEAFDRGDSFEVMDVLYNETRANLIELREIYSKRGLI